METKKKSRIKGVISAILVIAILAGSAYGVMKLFSIKTKAVSSFAFSVGGLSETDGSYVERKDAIYTKDAIDCQGLEITPKFDSKVEYQIFWYNEDDIYFGHTDITDKKLTSDIPIAARYCRIMIIPEALDENGKEITDFAVRFYEVYGYANDLTIKVNKNQDWVPVDLYEKAKLKTVPENYTVTSINEDYEFYEGWFYGAVGRFEQGLGHNDFSTVAVKLDCSEVAQYKMTFNETYTSENHQIDVIYFDSEGNELLIHRYDDVPGAVSYLEVPDNAKYIVFNVHFVFRPIVINEYLPK